MDRTSFERKAVEVFRGQDFPKAFEVTEYRRKSSSLAGDTVRSATSNDELGSSRQLLDVKAWTVVLLSRPTVSHGYK